MPEEFREVQGQDYETEGIVTQPIMQHYDSATIKYLLDNFATFHDFMIKLGYKLNVDEEGVYVLERIKGRDPIINEKGAYKLLSATALECSNVQKITKFDEEEIKDIVKRFSFSFKPSIIFYHDLYDLKFEDVGWLCNEVEDFVWSNYKMSDRGFALKSITTALQMKETQTQRPQKPKNIISRFTG